MSKPDPVAQAHYEKARQMYNEKLVGPDPTRESIEKKRSDFLTVASYIRLAIDHAQGHYPEASAFLSMIMFLLMEIPKAKHYAEIAISQQPHNFEARFVLLGIASMDLEEYRPHIDQSSLAGTLLTGAWGVGRRSVKKNEVIRAARNLISAFSYNVQATEKGDVEEWINMGEMLLTAADSLNSYGLREPEIYKAIMNAPWDQLEKREFADKVADLRARAEGLLLL